MSIQPEPVVHRWQWRILHASKELHPTTRHILLTLAVRMNPDGSSCYPSARRLSEETGLSKQTILTRLDEAERDGWIRREQRGQGRGWRGWTYTPQFPRGGQAGLPPKTAKVVKQVHHVTARGGQALTHEVVKELDPTRSVYPTRELLPPPIPSPREGSDAESGTDPPSQVPGEEVALRAEVEAGTAPPSSLPSENGRPGAGRFPSRELVELVRAEWWCGDLPPPDAPPAWTEGAECRFLERRIWPRLGDEGTRLFVRGVRLLAEADDTDLCVRAGDSGEPRPLLPAEGFTGALVQAWLRQNPGLPHEAVGAARKADELNHARDGPASGQHDSGPLRALATEVVNATERGA